METIVESDFMQAVDKELLYYLAHRYNKTPEQIISKFLIQDNLSGLDCLTRILNLLLKIMRWRY